MFILREITQKMNWCLLVVSVRKIFGGGYAVVRMLLVCKHKDKITLWQGLRYVSAGVKRLFILLAKTNLR